MTSDLNRILSDVSLIEERYDCVSFSVYKCSYRESKKTLECLNRRCVNDRALKVRLENPLMKTLDERNSIALDISLLKCKDQ